MKYNLHFCLSKVLKFVGKTTRTTILFILFFSTTITFGHVGLSASQDSVEISFSSQILKDPIACIFIGDKYFGKIPPGKIGDGKAYFDVDKLKESLPESGEFYVTVFIQGFSRGETILFFESSIYSCEVSGGTLVLEHIADTTVSEELADFVFGRFDELRDIRARIIEQGAQWTADINPVFMLPDDARIRLLGVNPVPGILPEERDTGDGDGSSRYAPKDLPVSIDWRDKDGYNWVTEIKNQGDCGSCWAFSVTGTAESQFLLGLDKPYLRNDMDLAEQHSVSCDHTCWPPPYSSSCNDGCNGGWPNLASDFMEDTGIPDEDCFPYVSGGSGWEPPCNNRCSDWEQRVKYICGWNWINEGESVNSENLKTGLQDAPLSVCMRVCYDFSSYSGGLYQNTCGSSGWEGWHAIILIGYRDDYTPGYWRMKNSWGTSWGDNGFCYLDYDESNYGESRFGTDALIHEYYLNADFSFLPTNPGVGEVITFYDNSTHCLMPITWDWDFGDGFGYSSIQNPTYSYSFAGTYTVILIVCDNNFCDTISFDVTASPNEPDLSYYSHEISDDVGGDSDGYPERGETISMPINLLNSGGSAINVTGVVSESDAFVSIVDANADFPDIPTSENRQSNPDHVGFVISDDDATCDHDVTFTVNWSCEGGTYTGSDNFVITLGCPDPELEYQSHLIDDEIGGDDDGFPEEGETIVLPVTLQHTGGANAQYVTGILSTSDPYIVVTDNFADWNNIAIAGSEQSNPDHFEFTISPGTPNEHIVDFTLDWDCYCGSGSDYFQVTVGGPLPRLIYSPPVNIDDSVVGDGDGYPEPGEIAVMAIPLRNDGTEDASAISGRISVSDPYITLTDNVATWSDIAVSATQPSNPDHFEFNIDGAAPCGHVVSFTLIDTCSGNIIDTNQIDITIGSPAPVISYSSHIIDDSGGGDGDGFPEPWEVFKAVVTLANSASTNANDVSATISTSDPYLIIIDNSADWNYIPGAGSAESFPPHFTIQVDESAPFLHEATVNIHWDAFCGSGDDDFIITIGNPTNEAPDAPELVRPFPFERIGNDAASVEPKLSWFIPTDDEADLLHFETRFGFNEDMSGAVSVDSRNSADGFEPSPPVAGGSGIESYIVDSQGEGTLTDGGIYWWDARAHDSNRWGDHSEKRSFTIATSQIQSDWFQTTNEQFLTGIAEDVEIADDKVHVTGMNIVFEDDFESYTSQAEFEAVWSVYNTFTTWQSGNYYSPNHAIRVYDNTTTDRSSFNITFPALSDGFISCRSMTESTSDEAHIVRIYTGSTYKGQLYYRQSYVAYWDGYSRHNLMDIDPGVWHRYQIDFDCGANEIYVIIDGSSTFGPFPFIGGAPATINLIACGTLNVANNSYTCDSYFDDYLIGQVGGAGSGMLTSQPICLDWNEGLFSWQGVIWTQDAGDSIVVVADKRVAESWTPFDSTIAAVSATAGTLDITELAGTDTIRIRAKLCVDGSIEPDMYDWSVQWANSILGIELLTLEGEPYLAFSTDILDAGETTSCDSAEGVWVHNVSDIPAGLLACAYDDTAYIPADSMLWGISPIPGIDICAVGFVLYPVSCWPDIMSAHWLAPNYSSVETGLIAGEDRYGYVFFKAPTDTSRYGEPQHRIKMLIKIIAE